MYRKYYRNSKTAKEKASDESQSKADHIFAEHKLHQAAKERQIKDQRKQYNEQLQAKILQRKREQAKQREAHSTASDEKPKELAPQLKIKLRCVLQGDPFEEVEENSKIVRVFTSSTFKDTSVERNELMQNVYPQLKEFCHRHGNYEFQVVDMRWGVRDETADDHMTGELCLKELQQCQAKSTGPNFVTFLSARYGSKLLSNKLESSLYNALANTLKEEDVEFLNSWYKEDTNTVPPTFILQPISSRYPHYYDNTNKEKSKDARNDWWLDSVRLRSILFNAAEQVYSSDPTKYHPFRMSVTEAEIENGLLTAKDPSSHCFWFKRDLIGLDPRNKSKMAGFYSDNSGEEEEVKLAGKLMDDLKTKIISKIPKENIKEYPVQWRDEGITLADTSHKAYVEQFSRDFQTAMQDMILKGIEDRMLSSISDTTYLEVAHHIKFCQAKCSQFQGRDFALHSIADYITSSNTQPYVLYGTSGSGKTSILAKAAQTVWRKLDGYACLILRFLGTTPESSNVGSLLTSIENQLKANYRAKSQDGIGALLGIIPNKESHSLTDILQSFEIPPSKPALIFLDSLDQLSAENNARQLKWLPKVLPENVKLILSTLPEKQYGCLPVLKAHIKQTENFFEVTHLKPEMAQEILKSGMNCLNRQLTPEQLNLVITTLQSNEDTLTPLYVKICIDEAALWRSYTALDDCRLQSTVQAAINALFDRIERQHGKTLVSHALGYLTASKNGLSHAEMEDLLSCDEQVLSDVYQYWTPSIRRLPPLLWIRIFTDLSQYLTMQQADGVQVIHWYHRQFIETATKKFLHDNNPAFGQPKQFHGSKTSYLHENLAYFFLGTWAGVSKPYKNKDGAIVEADRYLSPQPIEYQPGVFNLHKLSELPYHLLHAGPKMLDALKSEVILNFSFLLAKIKAQGLSSVQEDLVNAADTYSQDATIQVVTEVIKLSHDALQADPNQLAAQMMARLQYSKNKDGSDNQTDINTLLNGAANHKSEGILYSSGVFLAPPGGPIRCSLSTAKGKIALYGMSTSKDERYILLGLNEPSTIQLWDAKYSQLIHQIDSQMFPAGAYISQVLLWDNSYMVVSYKGGVKLFDFQTGEESHTISDINQSCAPGLTFIIYNGEPSIAVYDASKVIIYNNEMVETLELNIPELNQSEVNEQTVPMIKAFASSIICEVGKNTMVILDLRTYNTAHVKLFKIDVLVSMDGAIGDIFPLPTGEILVTSTMSQTEFEIYGLATGELIEKVSLEKVSYSHGQVTMTQDSRYIIITEDVRVELWDWQTKELAHVITHKRPISSAESQTGEFVTMLDFDASAAHTLSQWNINNLNANQLEDDVFQLGSVNTERSVPHLFLVEDRNSQLDMCMWRVMNSQMKEIGEIKTEKDASVIIVDETVAIVYHEAVIKLVLIKDSYVIHTIAKDVDYLWKNIIEVNGNQCVITISKNTILIYDIINCDIIRSCDSAGDNKIRTLISNPTGSLLICSFAKYTGSMLTFDIKGDATTFLRPSEEDYDYDLSIDLATLSYDGRFLAMISERVTDNRSKGIPNISLPGLVVWDLKQGKIVHKLHLPEYAKLNHELHFTSQGALLVHSQAQSVKYESDIFTHLWTLDEVKCTAKWKKAGHQVVALSDSINYALMYQSTTKLLYLQDIHKDKTLGAIYIDRMQDVESSCILQTNNEVKGIVNTLHGPVLLETI
ncbi:unnamed protein product [Owenia fusiformis]|uniref:Uncharacterized protein n=1 Tax=Owenia fusiformis TaxID=6347 RepID=A0A8J1TIF7_OWEFU|nr:unnamed protein product [Owenia fusiformis]